MSASHSTLSSTLSSSLTSPSPSDMNNSSQLNAPTTVEELLAQNAYYREQIQNFTQQQQNVNTTAATQLNSSTVMNNSVGTTPFHWRHPPPSQQSSVANMSTRATPLYNGAVKIPFPKGFDGRPGISSLDVVNYYSRMERFFQAVHINVESSESLDLAVMTLEGEASQWYSMRGASAEQDPTNYKEITNWVTLKAEINHTFVPLAQENISMNKLLKVKYHDSVERFSAAFNSHLQMIPFAYSPHSLKWVINLYLQGLESAPADIITEAQNAVYNDKAKTLMELQSIVLLAERIHRNATGKKNFVPRSFSVSPSLPRNNFSKSSSWRNNSQSTGAGNFNKFRNNFNNNYKQVGFSTPVKSELNHMDGDDDYDGHSQGDEQEEMTGDNESQHEEEESGDGPLAHTDPSEDNEVFLNAVKFYQKYSAKLPTLTPEEMARCRENKLCFNCKSAGHFSNKCPKKSNSASNNFHNSNVQQRKN